MNDICFVTTPISELMDDRLEAPLGYLYLASYLKYANPAISAIIYDICGIPEDKWDFPEAAYYGFSTYSTTYHRTLDIKKRIKLMYPTAKFIAGGAHASALPTEVIKDFDHVIVGEGERAIYLLLNKWIIDPIVIADQSILLNLDNIPYPNYDFVDVNSYHRIVGGKRSFSVLTTRGCPNKCTFCNSIIMGGGNKKVRWRSPENVIGEIQTLLDKYGDISIRFQDDMFGVDMKWLHKFTKLIKPLGITYRAFVRASQCAKREFTELLDEGGCRHVSLGIESGSDLILNAMQKGQTVEQGRLGLKNAKDAGLIRRIYLIVGYPGETWGTIKETVSFVKDTKPDEFVVYPLIIYPGTSLWRHQKEWGIRNLDTNFSHYFQIYGDAQSLFTYDLDYIDRHELQNMKDTVVAELKESHSIWARESKEYV